MRVALVTNYWHFESEKASSRYRTLAQLLTRAGVELEVVTSDFRHATKSFRTADIGNTDEGFRVTMLHEPGYSRNVSLARLISQASFARRVRDHLRSGPRPDLIYCAVPSVDVASRVLSYSRRRGVPLMIDVQDLWPEAFGMAVTTSWIAAILTWPMRLRANRVYGGADHVVAVSDTYLQRALRHNPHAAGDAVYLGIDLREYDRLREAAPPPIKPTDEHWIAYVGTLGHSYDLPTALDAVARLPLISGKRSKLIVMGDGPLRSSFSRLARDLGVYAEFTGSLPYAEMIATLAVSDVAINPIVPRSVASIINKHGDYLAAGLPMVSSQRSKELSDLLDTWNAGTSCSPSDSDAMMQAIQALLEEPARRKEIGANARRLAEVAFDRNVTYPRIVSRIMEMANSNRGAGGR